jgi:hypothetical protein
MNGLLGMSLLGWLISLIVGFAVGGVFFLSIKAQVNYVLVHRGRPWRVPALMYARMVFVGVILVVVAVAVPRTQLPAAVIAGVLGSLVARILVTRMVKKGRSE